MHILDHVQAKPESDPRGASPREYGGPQPPNVMDANIVVIKASPGALTNNPCLLLLNLVLCSFMIVH
jgi:hypothetical protein